MKFKVTSKYSNEEPVIIEADWIELAGASTANKAGAVAMFWVKHEEADSFTKRKCVAAFNGDVWKSIVPVKE